MTDFRQIIGLALDLHKIHRQAREVAIEVHQENDSLGASLGVRFMVPMPPGATAVANLESSWGFTVASRDTHLFRAESGDFYTLGAVVNQVAPLYIPYGVLKHRKAGIYTMEIKVVLLKPRSTDGDILANATTKIALPQPQPWHKVDYLWPFIGLCMAVIHADQRITTNEVRPLKAWLTQEFGLGADDMEGLRLAMKAPPSDLATLVASVRRRMPHISPRDLTIALLGVARLDGPVNPREHTVLRRIAALAGLDDGAWSSALEPYAV